MMRVNLPCEHCGRDTIQRSQPEKCYLGAGQLFLLNWCITGEHWLLVGPVDEKGRHLEEPG